MALIASLVPLIACVAAGQADGPWTRGVPMPTARSELTSQVVDSRWYVIGGGARAGAMTFIWLTELVEIFAPHLRGGTD